MEATEKRRTLPRGTVWEGTRGGTVGGGCIALKEAGKLRETEIDRITVVFLLGHLALHDPVHLKALAVVGDSGDRV